VCAAIFKKIEDTHGVNVQVEDGVFVALRGGWFGGTVDYQVRAIAGKSSMFLMSPRKSSISLSFLR